MEKPVLNLEKLLLHIKEYKKVKFKNISEEKRMKELLEIYNYSDIFSLKYLFSNGNIKIFDASNKYHFGYSYREVLYRDIEKQYKKLIKLESKLREAVLMYEIELKSHFIFFMEKFLMEENINFEKFLSCLTIYNTNTRTYELISESFKESLKKDKRLF